MQIPQSRFQLAPGVEFADAFPPAEMLVVSLCGKYYRLSGVARSVMLDLKGNTEESRAGALLGNLGEDELDRHLQALIRLGLVHDPHSAKGTDLAVVDHSPVATYMTAQLTLVRERYVSILAGPLTFLFNKWLMGILLPISLLAQIGFAAIYGKQTAASIHTITWPSLLAVAVTGYLSMFLHELGHAAGLLRAGQRPGRVGGGLYLIYPVFFTDVSRSWLVPANKRLVVNIGGLYVTGVLAVMAITTFVRWHGAVVGLVAYLLVLTTFMNFNPFVRMDGYWILSDLLDVHNLMEQTIMMNRWILGWIRNDGAPLPELASTRGRRRMVFAVYYCGAMAFVSYVLVSLLVFIVPPALHGTITHLMLAVGSYVKLGPNHFAFTQALVSFRTGLPVLLITLPIVIGVVRRPRTSSPRKAYVEFD